MKIETAQEAREYIESFGIKIKPGFPYNIYACGCVVRNDEDPQDQYYFPNLRVKNRTCPNHNPSALINKYKVCICGREYWSHSIQASEHCKQCPKELKKKTAAEKYKNKKKNSTKKFRNGHKEDQRRYNCVYRCDKKRPGTGKTCLDFYYKYDAVPCRGCKGYTVEGENADPLDRTFRDGE